MFFVFRKEGQALDRIECSQKGSNPVAVHNSKLSANFYRTNLEFSIEIYRGIDIDTLKVPIIYP